MTAASGERSKAERGIRLAVLVILAACTLGVLHSTWAFGQKRFFTVDEYQFGHATWLVSQGSKPYVDFYEHHFPASYVLHAPLLRDDGGFPERALRLRTISFAYLALLCGVLGVATRTSTRNACAAWLAALLPLGFGFSLMSAVDYRADTFATCLWLSCLALLDANRIWRRRLVALGCGALAGLAILMTQKMLLPVALVLCVLLGRDRWRARAGGSAGDAWLVRPETVLAATAGVLVLALGIAGALGLIPAAFQATILDAFQHEAVYPEAPATLGQFVAPFWRDTWPSTLPIAVFAIGFLVSSSRGFWLVPAAAAVAAVALAVAQYPYNYVFACMLGVWCAVRGYAAAVERLPDRGRLGSLRPLLYLLPLALLPDQLGFLGRASSNEQQMNMLRKIEAWTGEDDAVIDNAGGALFRDHASYYWYHGDAHQQMFADYFERELARDYRRSQALFWIIDFRLKKLPASVHEFLRRHYISADRGLYTLGFETPRTGDEARSLAIDVIRAGDYHVHPAPDDGSEPAASGRLRIDGAWLSSGSVHLSAGAHTIVVPPHSPGMRLSLLPPAAFERQVFGERPYTPLFQYDPPESP